MVDPTDDVYQETIKRYSRRPWWEKRRWQLIQHSDAIESEATPEQKELFFEEMHELLRQRRAGQW